MSIHPLNSPEALALRVDPAVIPPPDLSICFGGGDFLQTGAELLSLMAETGGLQPDMRVLDVGCGAGRLTAPLTAFLSPHGSYHGFDTFPLGVEWCRTHVSPRFPNFHFETVAVYNGTYNPFSSTPAAQFQFPYPDRSFDFVICNSVFTHMLPADIATYLREIRRVLRPGGRTCISFFLLDEAVRARPRDAGSGPSFSHRFGICSFEQLDSPEDVVGYEEPFIRSLHRRYGFTELRILYGSWRGAQALNYQDLVLGSAAD